MERDGFVESDFSDSQLLKLERDLYHTHLGIDYHDLMQFTCDSSDATHGPYLVGHNYQTTLTCTCLYYLKQQGFCKHRKRGELVLALRNLRIELFGETELTTEQRSKLLAIWRKRTSFVHGKETQEDMMLKASLNGNAGFSLLK